MSFTVSSENEKSFASDTPLTSAENVALNLLKHFNEQRLPRASELEWLVSEQDVPQKVCFLVILVGTWLDFSNYCHTEYYTIGKILKVF